MSNNGTPGGVGMQDNGDLGLYDDDKNPHSLAGQEECKRNVLKPGESLQPEEKLCSRNRAYFAILQNDGNFVIYKVVGK